MSELVRTLDAAGWAPGVFWVCIAVLMALGGIADRVMEPQRLRAQALLEEARARKLDAQTRRGASGYVDVSTELARPAGSDASVSVKPR